MTELKSRGGFWWWFILFLFLRGKTLDRWVYSVFFNVFLPFLTLESYYFFIFFLIECYKEDRLSLMDAQCGSLWFQENSPIIFCTYLLELLSKKGRGRRGNKKGKTMTAAKTSSLIVKYWVAFNGFYFALTCSLVGRAGHILPRQRTHLLSVFLFPLPQPAVSARERKRENEVICGSIDRQRGYWSGCCTRWRRVGLGGPSDSLSGWPAGINGHWLALLLAQTPHLTDHSCWPPLWHEGVVMAKLCLSKLRWWPVGVSGINCT